MKWRTIGLFGVGVGSVMLVCPFALGNGRYPTANRIAFDEVTAGHFIVGTTFGLLETRNQGATFSWACDPALSLVDQEDGMFAISASGETVISTFTGVETSSDGCSFTRAPDLAQKIVPDLSLSQSSPHHLLAFHMLGAADGMFDSQVVSSDDDGHTWASVGGALPRDLLPLTIDIAPSDPSRVYLSGRLGKADQYSSALYRSKDGGATFEKAIVPDSSGFRNAYIAAVHPGDPDRVFVRVDQAGTTLVLASRDGGQTFDELYRSAGQLLGFAIARDGSKLAIGGPSDGLLMGDASLASTSAEGSTIVGLQKRAEVGPTCLGFHDGALYVCADAAKAGFSLGRTYDLGATFEPLLRFDALCGASACASSSQVGLLCPSDWQNVAPTIGATCGLAGDAGRSPPSAPTAAPTPPESVHGSLTASGGCQFVAARWTSVGESCAAKVACFGVCLWLVVRRRQT